MLNGAVGGEVDIRIKRGFKGLYNGLIFTWGFVEMMWWFWIFVTLRDERKESAAKKTGKRSHK